jgi:tRNA dimethylallyltransferase
MTAGAQSLSTSATVAAPILFLAGPTAVGKSAVALHLARELDGEIVCVDSMQVYRGLDIGTAKPSPGDRSLVPHHLIDVAGLTERFDAAQFAILARAAVGDIQARRRVPILCGGTGLYIKTFLDGVGDAPPADPRLRAELEAASLPGLLAELELRDAETFNRIDRKNRRRVVRALEVIRLTGRPYSGQRAAWSGPSVAPLPGFFALTRQPADLRARIDARVDRMFQDGLVAETARLLDLGLAENPGAMQAIGYRQVVAYLRDGISLDETVTLVKTRSWQFARRQLTWLRRQLRPLWIGITPDEDPAAVAARVARTFRETAAENAAPVAQ